MSVLDLVRQQWDDIKGNLKYDILKAFLKSLFGAGLLTTVTEAWRLTKQMPMDWLFLIIVFVISLSGLLALSILPSRKVNAPQRPPIPQIMVNAKRLSDQKVGAIAMALGKYAASELGLFTLQGDYEMS